MALITGITGQDGAYLAEFLIRCGYEVTVSSDVLPFECTYLDDRSVHVDLVDVQKDDESVDEQTELIQGLVEDYVRHIHECAQAVQSITHN